MPKSIDEGATVELPDGRLVRVNLLDNGDVRIRIRSGGPYVISEAYVQAAEGIVAFGKR